MSLLNNKFDILRGWPREGAIDQTFPAKLSAGVPVVLAPGTVVSVQSDGSVDAATSPDLSSADALNTWVVIEGDTDFSGKMLGAVVCIRANAMLQLDAANLAAGTYTPGLSLSYNAGQWKPAASNNQVIGEIIKDNTAVDGTIIAFYTGGFRKKV